MTYKYADLCFQKDEKENPGLQTHSRSERQEARERWRYIDTETEVPTETIGGGEEETKAEVEDWGMEQEKELMPDLKPVPHPVYEEEERSGDNDWETEEGVDQEKEEEKEDLEMERERDRLEMERERQELEKEREAEQEREKMENERELERQREEWERMREEMERRREGNYDEEAGLPYPYPPGYYLLKVRAKE